jgi:alpha-ketoglutaric semialdehyde dehydrogenase
MPLEIFNPANPSEVVGTYAITEINQIDEIVMRARVAQKIWAQIPQPVRGEMIAGFVDKIEARMHDVAKSITLEMGKPLSESIGECRKALGEARMTLARSAAPVGDVFPSQLPNTITYSTRRPRGVILGISPYNFPFSTPMRKAIPALLYGNSIVLKPASIAPGAVAMMAKIAAETLPPDVLQIVIGEGGLGQSLSENSGIDGVSFTGSVETGKKVAKAAVGHLAEVSLELGGKNPVILHDSSDLDVALDQITQATFSVSGQRCTAISRVIVNREIYATVLEGLVKRARELVPMDGLSEGSKLGPLSSQKQLENVESFVRRAVTAGAQVVAGGSRFSTDTNGWFFSPTILTAVTRDMEVAREEIFGPVLAIIIYDKFDDALSIANDVTFGLSSCLYSETSQIIEKFLAESESGMLHVNASSFPENHMPFVGIKDSGLGVGGSNGPSTIQFYTCEHAVYRRGVA